MQHCHKASERFNVILTRIEQERIPLWAHLDLTYRCNLNCIHCYCQGLSSEFPGAAPELTTSEVKNALEQLAEAGSLYLTLSGGEVFMRTDFFEIAEYAKKLSFCLTIFTNGTMVDERHARAFAELTPLAVELSIYGATAEVHDAVTGCQGSFEQLRAAVALLKSAGLRVVLKSVLMRTNYHQAEDIERTAAAWKADDYRFTIEINSKNDGSRIPQQYQLQEAELRGIFTRTTVPFQQVKHEYWDNPLSKPLCGTATLGCYIAPSGIVYPCTQLLIPMGNLREKSFQNIWFSDSPLRKELALLKTYADLPSCRKCGYVRYCKKCIGLAFLEAQDMKKCYNTLEMISRIDFELSAREGG
jgi:radical SAM protein with 4Fe4S-binding SPASM domain